MIHVKQTTGIRNCGQVAVAALTGACLFDVIDLIGHSHGTQTKELRAALAKLGWQSDPRCYVRATGSPFHGLAKLRRATNGSGSWHWLALDGDMVYDGHQEYALPLQAYLEAAAIYFGVPVRITSYQRAWRAECSS